MTDLTAWRTLALRNALAENPHVAMTALAPTKLVLDTFERTSTRERAFMPPSHRLSPADATGLADSAAAKMIDERADAWRATFPPVMTTGSGAGSTASRCQPPGAAHCVSFGVNALYERPNPYSGMVSQHGLDRRMPRPNG